MSPVTGELIHADVFARLDTAVEAAYAHALPFKHLVLRADVSADELGEVEGFAVIDKKGDLLACVTAYRLENDEETPTIKAFSVSAKEGPESLEALVTGLLTKS